MSIINFLRKCLNFLNVDVKKYPSLDLRRRKKLLDYYKITKILDVGANEGQFAKQTQKLGFTGEILSFEPVESVFKVLENRTKNNKLWTAYNFGLGDKNEKIFINISKNTYSSSLLEIMPNHLKGAPESKYTHKEEVTLKTLDEIYDEIIKEDDVVFLKVDVQGFEKNVIEGAKKSLKKIKGIQLEMSLEELYKGEMLFEDITKLLKQFEFNLLSLENGFYDETSGKLLQVDGIFFKNSVD